MNQLGILHPGLLASLTTYHYATTVTIQEATVTQDSSGEEVQSWANLADHVDLPARIAPSQSFSREVRNQSQIYDVHNWVISIAGYYPNITAEMRVIEDSIAYDIELTQPDGNNQTTHLQVRKVDY